MKLSTWTVAIISVSTLLSCGKSDVSSAISPQFQTPAEEVEQAPDIPVKGKAAFGSQCPYGSHAMPQPVDITLEDCPISLSQVELVEPLQPLVLQADCFKNTIDVRGITASSYHATNWEFMPDGSFYFKVDAGTAKLKNDGAGNSNCAIPLTAEMWGHIDCTDRDKAVIQVETLWWLGMTPPEVTSSNTNTNSSGNPGSGSGRGTVTHISSYWPYYNPYYQPNYAPSTPSDSSSDPDPEPSPSPSAPPVVIAAPVAPTCQVSPRCYFHNINEIHQCQ